ncbi:MAG: hypothetical protein JRJ68_13850 [Deltaproteobacteria bacterium]|nr:hypothetical protein [Deltaproteobacteria bacterium]
MKRIVNYGFLAGLALFFAGCAVPQQPRTGEAELISQSGSPGLDDSEASVVEEDIEVTLPSMAYVNDRIFEYGRKLERWKELDSQSIDQELDNEEVAGMVQCFRDLQQVMNGYGSLRSAMLQARKIAAAKKISNDEILDLQKNDIDFLESECGRMLEDPDARSIGWSRREDGAGLAQLETLIDRYAASGEYGEVVRVWKQIPDDQIDRVQLRTRVLYGNGLIYLHQEEKAAEVYRQIIEQMSTSKKQATDIVSLRKILGDIYTASGNYGDAKMQYRKISADYANIGRMEEWSKLQLSILEKSAPGSAELTEYSSLLRNYLGFQPQFDGFRVARQAEKFLTDYPYSPVVSNVRYIKLAAMDGAYFWFNRVLAEADKLKAEKKFEESVELLETVSPDILNNETQTAVKEKNEEVLLAREVEKETERMEMIQELQRQWNDGMLLVNDGRYDEAIIVFSKLLDTEYGTKAEEKIKGVSLQAAKSDRRKAADLFIRSTKTADLESKKKLLVESRKLLNSILVKYPDVEIGSKVVGNIARVEQEMLAIDPNLLLISGQSESVDGEGQSPVEEMPGSVRP